MQWPELVLPPINLYNAPKQQKEQRMQENMPNFKIVPRHFSRTEDANGNVTIVDYSEKVDFSPTPMEPVAWMMRWTSNHSPSLTLDPSDYALERHRLIPLYEHPPTFAKCAGCCADLYGALQLIAYCKEYLQADPSTVGGRPEAEYLVAHIDAYMARRKSPERLPVNRRESPEEQDARIEILRQNPDRKAPQVE